MSLDIILNNMLKLEQFASSVLNYTSKFNTSDSVFYAPGNLVGKYEIYPNYGDFPETYSLRTYGTWWKQSEAYQKHYMPQDVDPLLSEDYITLMFENAVIPRDVFIYETYNPGAVVRIWGRYKNSPWILLWEGFGETLPDESRKFNPKLNKVNSLINTLRIEFNQSHLKYHTSLDAVLLAGFEPVSKLQKNMILNQVIEIKPLPTNKKTVCNEELQLENHFSKLPIEVVFHIFQFLDLKSLSKCAQVNKQWLEATFEPCLYQNISLKRYWHLVDSNTMDFLMTRCRNLKKLDLSWCGNDDKKFCGAFKLLLKRVYKTLTHLSLNSCSFVNNEVIIEISNCKDLSELRLKSTHFWSFSCLEKLTNLVTLDLSETFIKDLDVIKILKANPFLKHIILDLCEELRNLNQVVETVAQYNKQLTVWSSWKAFSLTSEGVCKFEGCPHLTELDLGWCLKNTDPGESLDKIAMSCRKLKRLVLSEWRGINDHLLYPIIRSCSQLTQLDLMGIKSISAECIETALVSLENLELLDISYCDSIRQEQVDLWRQQFPKVTIQRSCQFVVNDYLN